MGDGVVLIGREGQLAAVAEGLRAGRAVLIHGERGTGRSALLARAARENAGDRRVLAVRALPGDEALPGAGLQRLLLPVISETRALTGPAAAAFARLFGSADSDAGQGSLVCSGAGPASLGGSFAGSALLGGSGAGSGSLAGAVAALVERSRGRERWLWCVDDLDRLDELSWAVVLGPGMPPLLATTQREGTVRLGRLSRAGSERLLAGLRDHPAARVALAQAAGNPLALTELARTLPPAHETAPTCTELPTTPRLRAALAPAVAGLDAARLRAALLAAFAAETPGRETTVALDVLVAPQVWEELIADGVLRPGRRFRHPVVRAAVVERAGLALSREARHELAARLPRGDARWAWHVARAEPGADEAVAGLLARAGAELSGRGRARAAAYALAMAAERSADPRAAVERRRGAARSARLAGEAAWERQLGTGPAALVPWMRRLRAGLDPDPTAPPADSAGSTAAPASGATGSASSTTAPSFCATAGSDAAPASGATDSAGFTVGPADGVTGSAGFTVGPAGGVIGSAGSAAGPAYGAPVEEWAGPRAGDPCLADGMEAADLGQILRLVWLRGDRAALDMVRSLRRSGRLDEPPMLAVWAGAIVDDADPQGWALRLLHEYAAPRTGTTPPDMRGIVLGTVALARHETALAAVHLARALDLAPRGGIVRPVALGSLAWARYDAGDLDEAAAYARRLLDAAGEFHHVDVAADTRAGALTTLAVVALLRGEPERERRVAEARSALQPGRQPLYDLRLIRAQGLVAAVGGDHGPAFHRLRRQYDAAGDPVHHRVSDLGLADLAQAAVAYGREEEVAGIAGKAESRITSLRSTRVTAIWHRARALLAGSDARAETHYRLALADPRTDQWAFERALTRMDYAIWLRRRHRPAESRPLLTAARDAFAAAGLTAWRERADAELAAAAAPPRPGGAPLGTRLTPQQRQVVVLAAQGLTNQQIAARLGLSARTVGSHLSRAYPVLGVTRRTQLPAVVSSRSTEDGPVAPGNDRGDRKSTERRAVP